VLSIQGFPPLRVIFVGCDLDSNINFVDITYAAIGSPPSIRPTFASNPRRVRQAYPLRRVIEHNIAAGGTSALCPPSNIPIEFGSVQLIFLKGLAI
jgi:hypothetical protein